MEGYVPKPGDTVAIIKVVEGKVLEVYEDGKTFLYLRDGHKYLFKGDGQIELRSTTPAYEVRENCKAEVHDTLRAYQKHKCRCPKAVHVRSVSRTDYYRRNREKVLERVKRRQEALAEGAPKLPAQCHYGKTEEHANWSMAEKIVKEGPQKNATVYDRWLAIQILNNEKRWTNIYIADRVGVSPRAVYRYQAYLKSLDKEKGSQSGH